MVAPLLLAGCEVERAPADKQSVGVRPHDQGGRIVDLAGVLNPADKLALGRRLAFEQQADGRAVMVIIMEAGKEQSLEQVGWAVGGASGVSGHFLILIDPTGRQVRIEGRLRLEHKAAVAAAMQDDLAAGRLGTAINRGLDRLEQLAP